MKPRSNPLLHASRLALLAITIGSLPAIAGTTWDGGGTPNTHINTPANWDSDAAPSLLGTTGVLFQSANNVATLNVPAAFRLPITTTPAVAFGANFTLNATGGNELTLYGTNSGANAPVLRTNSGASAVTISAPIKVFATTPVNSPLGALLIIGVNNTTAANTALTITGGISLATGSTGISYDIRYAGTTSATQAKARIGGTISGLATLTTMQSGTPVWGGDLIIVGDQASTATSNIFISSVGAAPSTNARLVLGESNADDQAWNNITLSNVMNLAIGGNITANVFSGNLANTKITGASSTGNISFNSGTIGANVVLGGIGTNENDLSIIKKSSGILNINSTTATYTGATTVEAGTLNISSTANLASPITVQVGATLGGEGATTSTVTFGSGTSTLSFDPTTAGSFTTAALSVTGANVITNPTGATTVGTPYTVLTKSAGTFTAGDVSAFLAGGRGTISGAGTNKITFTPTAPASLTWKGNAANPTFWDVATTFNWNSGVADRFFAGDAVTFDNTASNFSVAVQGALVTPGNIVFSNNSPNDYTLTGGGIGGSGSLTKGGSGLTTINNSLSHSGGITLNTGTLSLGTSNTNTFTGGIIINGGELQFGGATALGSLNAQAVTLNGGTITRTTNTTVTNDVQTFAINANGVVIKVDSNATTTWRIGGKVSGIGNWTKSGTGVLSLGRSADVGPGNDFTGTVTVTAGTLDVRHATSLGSTAAGTSIEGAILLMQNFGQTDGSTITVAEPLSFSGNAFLTGYCQETKSFTQQFTGPVTLATSSVVGVSTTRAGVSPAPLLELNASTIVTGTGSILSFGLRPSSFPGGFPNAAQTINVGSAISGPGAVTAEGDVGSVYTLSAPGYSGNTTVNSATLKLGAANPNNDASTVTVASGAQIDIAFPGNDTVATLILGGVTVPAGTYNASHPTYGSFFIATDAGSIVVPTPTGGYSAWQTANSATGQTVDQDHDNDGVKNGIEYFLGGSANTTGFTALPAPVAGAITYTKAATYTGSLGTGFKVQSSTNLISWTDASSSVTPAVPGTVFISGNNVTYTLPTGAGKTFARLLVNPN